ncbi:P-loop containing nucleoside triphosphate hydrolase protein [Fistulina hepatica ATCC 64428]|uniref:p-loop containing nucleoside triphosphate hydrolase protein n=1 Tax=Fistulina hepatica ATCC 64428 TaxID=1128425 RepID=A0A0D7A2X7_9AGAR|nr:P-loop containing nucleoside triphosphate hydrolase protein [Fistulina hepatica ATCC 64428]
MAPPPNETPRQRQVREMQEELARQISQKIDEELRAERVAMKQSKKAMQVLLLGQTRSGKSTIMKNLQMMYAPTEWATERASWKVVIQLNLVRAVNMVLDALVAALESSNPPPSLTHGHKVLALRLAPLRQIQQDLEARLGSASKELEQLPPGFYDGTDDVRIALAPEEERMTNGYSDMQREFYVMNNTRWKQVLKKVTPRMSTGSDRTTGIAKMRRQIQYADDISEVIAGCQEDIRFLWKDKAVRDLTISENVVLEESASFFLDEVDRIATSEYEPSDEDVLRCRLRTTGVQEYHLHALKTDWIFYDFCGSRQSRSCLSYFNDVQSIIFLAPLSVFDEVDEEGVNRLRDSLQLWHNVCSNKYLENVKPVLFLNKYDVLKAKLRKGRSLVKDHFPSYKDRPQDTTSVCTYFKAYFRETMIHASPIPRDFYAHLTSAVDFKGTSLTLRAVQDAIVRNHLALARMI